ncbi:nitroreductase family protein [Glaciibacter superstes]|uniref:nitroreductase family protein n=1 Tax=Glaciibacter superstes TaxID=501023 RepID=UPI00047951CC|nr:nitroreductase family protein [Glaciibacter superstes]
MTETTSVAHRNRFMHEDIPVSDAYMNDTVHVITAHESVRAFESRAIPDEMLTAILTAARSAPTSSNLQAYSVIVVDDEASKSRLAVLAGEQECIAQAPLLLVFCADVNRLRYVAHRQGREFGGDTLEMFLLASVDAALVMQNTLVAAESLGLATTPIGSVRDRPDLIAEELELPEGVYAVAGLCVGFERAGERRGTKPRLPENVTIHRNKYSEDAFEAGISDYDDTMMRRRTYAGRHIQVPGEVGQDDAEYGWAEHTALRCSSPEVLGKPADFGRRLLRSYLEGRGFSFD